MSINKGLGYPKDMFLEAGTKVINWRLLISLLAILALAALMFTYENSPPSQKKTLPKGATLTSPKVGVF